MTALNDAERAMSRRGAGSSERPVPMRVEPADLERSKYPTWLPSRRFIAAVVAIGGMQLLATMDSTVAIVALPKIQDELSLEQLGEIIGLGEKVQHLQNSDEFEFDEAMVELIGGFFDGMLRIAIVGDYDAELKDLVPVVQKAQIVTAFTETCLGTPTQLATALAEKRQEQTGE